MASLFPVVHEQANRHYWQEDWKGFLEVSPPNASASRSRRSRFAIGSRWASRRPPVSSSQPSRPRGPDEEEERRLAATLTTPVLVIHGTDDHVIPLARSEELARLTGGELAVVQGSGHEPQYRHPDEVNALLDGFFDDHYPPDTQPARA
jgi:pimeloyl-ACP methyl ester carboxylesterase